MCKHELGTTVWLATDLKRYGTVVKIITKGDEIWCEVQWEHDNHFWIGAEPEDSLVSYDDNSRRKLQFEKAVELAHSATGCERDKLLELYPEEIQDCLDRHGHPGYEVHD